MIETLIIPALITWRITILLNERLPFGVGDRLRYHLAKFDELDYLFNCIYCLSMWVAAGVCLAFGEKWYMLLVYSSLAILFNIIVKWMTPYV